MNWTWHRAGLADVHAIVNMAQRHFESEADTIFATDPLEYARNVSMAISSQMWNPYTELVMVARHQDQIVAYMWARRNERAAWSSEEMVVVRMAHIDMSLSARHRVTLVKQMIGLWEVWAAECGIPIVCSTTMRQSQDGFLRIHHKLGYDVRGSIAYKRLT